MIDIKIVLIGQKSNTFVEVAVKLLNQRQNAFNYEVKQNDRLNEYCKDPYSTTDTYAIMDEEFGMPKLSPFVIGVVNNRLNGAKIGNLFASLQGKRDIPGGKGIASSYYVENLLKPIPLEIYYIFQFISFTLRFVAKKKLIHEERRLCPFDLKLDKSDIVPILKAGNICLECKNKIDEHLNFNHLLAISTILNIIGKIARSKDPERNLVDFITINEYVVSNNLNLKVNENEFLSEVSSNIILLNNSNAENPRIETIPKLKLLISSGQTKEVFEELLKIAGTKSRDMINQIIILYAHFNQILFEDRIGILTSEYKTIEKNKINKGLLEIIDTI